MTSYTSVFGTDAVPASEESYASVSLTASTTFEWPELSVSANIVAEIMDIASTGAYTITMPVATQVSVGRAVLMRNTSAFTITVVNSAAGAIGTVLAGEVKFIYLTSNATAAGTWAIFTFGTGASSADASALAGTGLVAAGGVLSQESPISAKVAGYTVIASDRAGTITFTNAGSVTCALTASASIGADFFCYVSNQGTGQVVIDPAGAELIDGASTKGLAPLESCMLVCTGTGWVTIGFGRSTQFQFTKLVLDISAGTPFTITSAQAQNKLIQTIGTITAGVTINLPTVVSVYYVQCEHTGAFSTTFKTAAGTGVVLQVGDRAIIYCDGVNVVAAQTASAPATTLSGGVAGSIVYQSAANTTAFSNAGATGQLVVSGGTGAPTFINNTAASIVNAPAGNIAAVTVQAAINELDTEKQAVDATLTSLAALGTAADKMLYTTGIDTWAEAALTSAARSVLDDTTVGAMATTLGLGTGNSPEFTAVNIGHASNTTITQVSAGVIAVEGNTVAMLAATETFTAPQRGTLTTDNDLSFDLNVTNNFFCTPSAGVVLTFTNHASGQS